ncbi:MAG: hypothetical protein ACRDMZ_05160, partial [Solirubrobacteraceae bacterium]
PAAITQRRWQAAIARALDAARVPYTIVDESVGEDELAGHPSLAAVIAPTLDRIDRGLAHTLRALTEHPARVTGVHAATSGHGESPPRRKRVVVVIGPGTPAHDELGQPLADAVPRRVGRLMAGSLDDIAGLATDLGTLAAGSPAISDDAWELERPEGVQAYAHADASGAVRVVFVASDLAKPATAVLRVGGSAHTLRDPFRHERIAVDDGRASIALPPRGVRMLVVEIDPDATPGPDPARGPG